MDKDAAKKFILSTLTFEGGFAAQPHLEAHGAFSYCAIASLKMMDELDCLSSAQVCFEAFLTFATTKFCPFQVDRLVRWCINRLENEGFNGRPNKPSDTCYTFWVGAVLDLLQPFPGVDQFICRAKDFVLETQDEMVGGLAKAIDVSSDPMHTYLGLAGLSFGRLPGLKSLDTALNIAQR